jgi:hypothetical protein
MPCLYAYIDSISCLRLLIGSSRRMIGPLMRNNTQKSIAGVLLFISVSGLSAAAQFATSDANKVIAEADCTADKVGTAIPVSAIGEPVSGVALSPPRWVAASGATPAYCAVDGSMAPVDRAPSAKPILFRVALPASWNRRAAQLGGGGTNGVVPNLTGEPLQRGFAAYGSDSGHQNPPPGPRGAPPNPSAADWWFNDEAVRNFGYMQMKKTHDAAMVLIERMYGERPGFNYYIGNSQGGREALTVAQRYSADYDGILATVPVVSLSSFLRLILHSKYAVEPVAGLLAGTLDVAFVRGPVDSHELQSRELLREQIVMMLPAHHPLARRKRVPVELLNDLPCITMDRLLAPGLYDAIAALYRQAHIRMHAVSRADNVLGHLRLVQEGLGFALLPDSMGALLPPGVVMKPLECDPVPTVSIAVAWKSGNTSPLVRAFIDLVRKCCGNSKDVRRLTKQAKKS